MESGELKRRFGRHVQGLREAAGLTQEQLADRIGRSVDTVSNIERGVNGTRIEVAYQIAGQLGVSLSALFAFEEAASAPGTGQTAAGAALLDLLEGRDEATVGLILDLVRVGLRIASRPL